MQQEVIKQHYVPQFYLRKFGKGKKKDRKLYVFNKKTLKIDKEVNTKVIANEDYFYDLTETMIEKICKIFNINNDNEKIKIKQIFENTFSNIEKKSSDVFNSITNKIKNYFTPNLKSIKIYNFITLEEREIFSLFLAIQYIRTYAFREQISFIYQMGMDKIGEIIQNKAENISEEEKKKLHILHLTSFIQNTSIYFYRRMWFFNYNVTNKNLCTSDNPINFIQMTDLGPYGIGLATADIIAFPLTPKIMLYMYNPIRLVNKEEKTDKEIAQEINNLNIETSYVLNKLNTLEDVEESNLNQAYHCQKEVYSIDGDFERILDACKINKNNIQKSPNERIS